MTSKKGSLSSKGLYHISKQPITMNEYEQQRCLNIERNAMKFKEMGLHKLALQLMDKKKHMETKGKDKYKGIVEEDVNYIPDEEENDDEELHHEPPKVNVLSSTLTSTSKKVMLHEKINRITRQKKSSYPRKEMGDFIEASRQKESTTNQPHHVLKDPIVNVNIHGDMDISNKKRKQVSLSMDKVIRIQEDEPTRQTLEDELLDIQQEREQSRIEIQQEVVLPSDREENAMLALEKYQGLTKKHRGPTMLYEVHGRKYEDRKPIFFNEINQPIGPNDKDVDEFTRFLGTIVCDHAWVPLTYISWHYVPDKDKIWDYVNSKYIIPESSKKWVMGSIGADWKRFKFHIKREHFKKYDT